MTYISPADLRLALGVDEDTVSDAQANATIADAEDAIDELLGGWPPDETTGRKIVEADVEPWQFDKLKRATTKLAVALFQQPDLLARARWSREKGPDFEVEGPRTRVIGTDVMLPLNQSLLRRLTGRAVPNSGPSQYDSFLRATRHNGT